MQAGDSERSAAPVEVTLAYTEALSAAQQLEIE